MVFESASKERKLQVLKSVRSIKMMKHHQDGSAHMGRKLKVLLSLVTLLHMCQLYSCASQQQQRPLEDQAAVLFSSGGEPMAINGDSLFNLGHQFYTSKRNRKMSAFMPMRGRKDGRDEGELMAQPSLQPYHDNEAEASIMRLVSDSLAAASALPEDSRWVGVSPAPRQFANQFALRHLLAGAGEQVNNGQPLMGEFAANQEGGLAAGMMQAKLRRAFHPMRGKKSDLALVNEAAGAYSDDILQA